MPSKAYTGYSEYGGDEVSVKPISLEIAAPLSLISAGSLTASRSLLSCHAHHDVMFSQL